MGQAESKKQARFGRQVCIPKGDSPDSDPEWADIGFKLYHNTLELFLRNAVNLFIFISVFQEYEVLFL
ncbi:hypothetical protein IFU37_010475 [Pantoea agglomerans]|jgi:hypothetical protein|uniref:hypothetical protein n=1 Tax=Enterobacter agglomerans TaxID=549 RepID=UPI00178564E0|nr:hypothetical protein [Pantoea agglomerans]WVL88086.1 hypothetical protein IFU37_010475 [Pantoea agglomerans]